MTRKKIYQAPEISFEVIEDGLMEGFTSITVEVDKDIVLNDDDIADDGDFELN